MKLEDLVAHIRSTFPAAEILVASPESGAPEVAWGDVFVSYDPEGSLPETQRFPFATIVTKDYPGFDEESHVSRVGVYRLNIGVGKITFRELFGQAGADMQAESLRQAHDFAAFDVVMPHPVYHSQSWVCILNPTRDSLSFVTKLLQVAYEKAANRVPAKSGNPGS